jgi:hypothetical protein
LRIIKREKGAGVYYYLQHSYREEGKVVTKERYLGKTIPENVEEINAQLVHEAHTALSGKIERIRNNFQKVEKNPPLG